MNDRIELTASQRAAVDSFRAFLAGDSQVFMLKGAAGTGKTTLVAEFLNILEGMKRDARLMAPTGRAAYIIGSKTGHGALTIHRGIYILTNVKSTSLNKEDEDDGGIHARFGLRNDEDDGGIHARFGLRNNEDSVGTVYIVDESSMISDAFSQNEAFSFGTGMLLSDLFEFAHGRKIVFVGDYAQLPPIGMNFSPALDKEYIRNKFSCGVEEVILREVMRQQSGSVMLENASRVRDSIERKSFVEFALKDGIDSESVKVDLLRPYFALSKERPCHKAAIIAYSNRQALDYNLYVRQHYFGDGAPRLLAGDLLMIARNNYAYEYELFNGNIVKVEACQPDREMIRRIVRVKTGKNRIETVELRFRKVTICFAAGGKKVSLNVIVLDNFMDDPSGSIGGLLARALIVDFDNRLPEEIKSRLSELRRLMRSKEGATHEQQRLMKNYLDLLQKDPYYNSLICKYGYAMTCHKAQGGEWDNVFVDMCRFGGTANEDYFRWAYTAITRSSRKLWHFHSPEFNYISGLVVEEIKPSSNIKVSTYSDGQDFRAARFNRIKELCGPLHIAVSDDRTNPYLHKLEFTDEYNRYAVFQLGNKAKGYNGKEEILYRTEEEFAIQCKDILESSLVPSDVPFNNPERPFACRLVAFMKSQMEELGIQLLDITQERYQDVFHLRTDGLAKVGLSYTDKGNYTYMKLTSSLGAEDSRLEELRRRFI